MEFKRHLTRVVIFYSLYFAFVFLMAQADKNNYCQKFDIFIEPEELMVQTCLDCVENHKIFCLRIFVHMFHTRDYRLFACTDQLKVATLYKGSTETECYTLENRIAAAVRENGLPVHNITQKFRKKLDTTTLAPTNHIDNAELLKNATEAVFIANTQITEIELETKATEAEYAATTQITETSPFTWTIFKTSDQTSELIYLGGISSSTLEPLRTNPPDSSNFTFFNFVFGGLVTIVGVCGTAFLLWRIRRRRHDGGIIIYYQDLNKS